jgi:L-fuconolactonase
VIATMPALRALSAPIVDSHCHATLAWFEPVETLVHQMDRNGVAHAILIQVRGQYDNSYQDECLRRYPGRFASVVGVDWEQPDAVARLEHLAAQGASGVRLRPWTRSPGDDPLAVWRAAERLGLAVSCLGADAEFATPEFRQVVEAVPGLKIVLEHLAGVGTSHPTWKPDVHAQVVALARYPSLYVKIPGLGEFCERAMPVREPFMFVEPIPDLLPRFYDAYGPRRLMWGSDFPPVAGREGYANALRLAQEQFADRSQADREAIFGGTALDVFPLRR